MQDVLTGMGLPILRPQEDTRFTNPIATQDPQAPGAVPAWAMQMAHDSLISPGNESAYQIWAGRLPRQVTEQFWNQMYGAPLGNYSLPALYNDAQQDSRLNQMVQGNAIIGNPAVALNPSEGVQHYPDLEKAPGHPASSAESKYSFANHWTQTPSGIDVLEEGNVGPGRIKAMEIPETFNKKNALKMRKEKNSDG